VKSANWIIVPVLVLLPLAATSVSARAAIAAQSATEKTKDGAEKTKDAVVKGAKVTGEKTKDVLSKTGEVMTDAWVTTRVNQRFVSDDLLKGSDINVDTNDHIVTLKGTVTTSAGRSKATTIAKRTEGVHSVVNKLTIGPKVKS
jgi:hyperosmotically inducible protein